MATEVGQIYRCTICGNQVEVLEAGGACWSAAEFP